MILRRTNWHEAAVCAIQIDLRDYAHMLEYHPEYTLSNNNNRIDLLVIRKLLNEPIPKSIARIFKSYNLFEIKGICSSLTTDAYYKTNGHAVKCTKRRLSSLMNYLRERLCICDA